MISWGYKVNDKLQPTAGSLREVQEMVLELLRDKELGFTKIEIIKVKIEEVEKP